MKMKRLCKYFYNKKMKRFVFFLLMLRILCCALREPFATKIRPRNKRHCRYLHGSICFPYLNRYGKKEKKSSRSKYHDAYFQSTKSEHDITRCLIKYYSTLWYHVQEHKKLTGSYKNSVNWDVSAPRGDGRRRDGLPRYWPRGGRDCSI